MARVLITGGTGFIGAHLARDCLARGDEVTVLARPGSDPWRLADVRDRIALVRARPLETREIAAAVLGARPERVFHLAAATRIPARDDLSDLGDAIAANVAPLRVLLDAVRRLDRPPQAVVRAGTLAELGESDRVLDPDAAERPQNGYGLSALMGTHLLRLARARLGLPAVTARLCLTYGGDQSADFLIPDLIRKTLAGIPVHLQRPQARRDLLHVSDCVAALQAAADHAAALPPVIAVSTGRPFRMGQVAAMIAALTGDGPPHRPPAQTVPAAADAAHVVSCRPSPELAGTGWRPRIGLARGLRRTIAWEQARTISFQERIA